MSRHGVRNGIQQGPGQRPRKPYGLRQHGSKFIDNLGDACYLGSVALYAFCVYVVICPGIVPRGPVSAIGDR